MDRPTIPIAYHKKMLAFLKDTYGAGPSHKTHDRLILEQHGFAINIPIDIQITEILGTVYGEHITDY